MNAKEMKKANELGFVEKTVKDLEVGDEVCYFETLFDEAFGPIRITSVTQISRPEPDYPELVRVSLSGATAAELEEGESVMVRKAQNGN